MRFFIVVVFAFFALALFCGRSVFAEKAAAAAAAGVNINFAHMFQGASFAPSSGASDRDKTLLQGWLDAYFSITFTENGDGVPVDPASINWNAVNAITSTTGHYYTSRPASLKGYNGNSIQAYHTALFQYYALLTDDLSAQIHIQSHYLRYENGGGEIVEFWSLPKYKVGANPTTAKVSFTWYRYVFDNKGVLQEIADFPDSYVEASLLA